MSASSEESSAKKKRGPKGGIKHQPGRGHDTRSGKQRKKRFRRKAEKKRQEKQQAAREAWRKWDELSEEQRKLLGPQGKPTLPRPPE